MIGPIKPKNMANRITQILNCVYGDSPERFPVQIAEVAKEYSSKCFPDDPILHVDGGDLPGFEGALMRIPKKNCKGWGILYNDNVSEGRRNFTIAHELGHYLLHRGKHPDGIQCSPEDMVKWGSDYQQIESQANDFAATILMPFDDYRKQIDSKVMPNLDSLSKCANRYGVSLIASILQWLEYTETQSVLVVSRDGFIKWSRSSNCAMKNHKFLKTSDQVIEVPARSLASQARFYGETSHDTGVWFDQPCREMVLTSNQYDITISLLHFEDAMQPQFDEENDQDVLDFMERKITGIIC